VSEGPAVSESTADRVRAVLSEAYERASVIAETEGVSAEANAAGVKLAELARSLGALNHASRGVALTLSAYKAVAPQQDITAHMTDFPGGFAGRAIDTDVTVPFLQAHSLPKSSQSHWLTRRIVERRLTKGLIPKTTPKQAGPLLVQVVNAVNDSNDPEVAAAVVTLIMLELVLERNRSRVSLTRPKHLTIAEVVALLDRHFSRYYKKNAPRLPQLAMYAAYECLLDSVERYSALALDPLLSVKAADRKAGTVGDVVVRSEGVPFEGVEVKLGIPVSQTHVFDAIDKLRSATVERYFVLSTAGVDSGDRDAVEQLVGEFRASNGCEIIVNGVVETISYYMRLLESPFDFIVRYVNLVETDDDLGYEHRVAWNEICAELHGT
jgi:DNA (cytosine-5)-methyltransferase 1